MPIEPSRKPAPPEHPPRWRVEGAPDPKPPGQRRGPMGLRRPDLDLGAGAARRQPARLVPAVEVAQPAGDLVHGFQQQVKAATSPTSSSTGNTIQGDFKRRRHRRPARGAAGRSSSRRELPTFVDNARLDTLLAQQRRRDQRQEPGHQRRRSGRSCCSASGRRCSWSGSSSSSRAGFEAAWAPAGRWARSAGRRHGATSTTSTRVTFKDVAGIDEADRRAGRGRRLPAQPRQVHAASGRASRRACCWPARPGTGKTLLARAVAGEADVPFFSIAASEFVEAIVGVGASRVRDLFGQAKAAAPAIIFIDELDAIGRVRGVGIVRRQRRARADPEPDPDRDGRLHRLRGRDRDRRPPTARGARPARCCAPGASTAGSSSTRPTSSAASRSWPSTPASVPLADDVDLASLAASTSGMVGADLRNLVNEAALLAARREHDTRRRWPTSPTRSRRSCSAPSARSCCRTSERERTAYHESGHALLGMLVAGSDPVRKISIIPRGRALGVTFQSPDADRYGYSVDYLRGRLIGALGGRAAEQLVYGDTRPAPSPTSSRPPGSPARWSAAGACPSAIGPSACSPAPATSRSCSRARSTPSPSTPASWSMPRCGGSWTSARRLALETLASTASSSTRWRTRCSSTRRWTRPTPTGSRASAAIRTACRPSPHAQRATARRSSTPS